MKFSDEVASRLKEEVSVVFGITGGAVVNLLDSIHKSGIKLITMHHEQACAMAADAYSRLMGFGVAIGTSGPGATNLITGTCCSWFDSIPVLTIAGQVPRNQLKGISGVRQNGFQETDTIVLFQSITKSSRKISSLGDVDYSIKLAKEGRPGPVFLEFCDDDQRESI